MRDYRFAVGGLPIAECSDSMLQGYAEGAAKGRSEYVCWKLAAIWTELGRRATDANERARCFVPEFGVDVEREIAGEE